MFCREQVAQLRDKAPEIRALGAEPVAVGCGRPDQAADFALERNIDFPLFVDPKLLAYAAAGLRRGASTVLSLGTLANGLRALKSGFRQGATQGDPWQQGGTFVILPDRRVVFEHISQRAGDHAGLDKVLAALRRAVSAV